MSVSPSLSQGLIEKDKLDTFNLPVYGPTVEEVQSIVEAEQSFEIENMRLLTGFPLHPLVEVREGEEERVGRKVSNFYRALFENIVGTHLGSDEHPIDEIFKRIAAKYEEFVPNNMDLVVAVLIRKRA